MKVIQATIHYCPVCGANITSFLVGYTGGHWHCLSCDQVGESILSREQLRTITNQALVQSEDERQILVKFCPVCCLESEKSFLKNPSQSTVVNGYANNVLNLLKHKYCHAIDERMLTLLFFSFSTIPIIVIGVLFGLLVTCFFLQ